MSGIDQYTKLLLHADGERSDGDHTVVQVGGASTLSLARKKFNPGSLYFGGTGAYCYAQTDSGFDLSNIDWTIDLWYYEDPLFANQVSFFEVGSNDVNTMFLQRDDDASPKRLYFIVRVGSTAVATIAVSGLTIAEDQWHHLSVSCDQILYRLYLDGQLIGSTAYVSPSTGDKPFAIGRRAAGPYYLRYGNVDDVRVSRGIARQTGSSFTLPTDTYEPDAYTEFLLSYEGDYMDTHEVEVQPGAEWSKASARWGGSYRFDGSTGRLELADSADWDFGADDFTVDCWVNTLSAAESHIIGRQAGSLQSQEAWYIVMLSDGRVRVTITDGVTPTVFTSTGAINNGVWRHLALVRYGSGSDNFRLYIDGTNDGTATFSGTINQNSSALHLAARWRVQFSDAVLFFNGYIDEVRVSKGIARWVSDFTPPTEPYSSPQPVPPVPPEPTPRVLNRFRVKNSQGVFVPVGVEALPQLMDAGVDYPAVGDLMFFTGFQWVNARLRTDDTLEFVYNDTLKTLSLQLVE